MRPGPNGQRERVFVDEDGYEWLESELVKNADED